MYFYIFTSQGNIETDYFVFMYRLMKTVETEFLNESIGLSNQINPFSSIEDIILHKNHIREHKINNNSTYITKDSNGVIQIFGKLYGANKYETTLLSLALHKIASSKIELFEIEEGNLKKLPRSARSYLLSLDSFDIVNADITLEESEFERNDSLRSPRYIYNLLEKLGDKKCAFCECEIPQIIQGAHIWNVADIKKENQLAPDEKLAQALDGDNGLWLCQNHHKLLDVNILRVSNNGLIKYKTEINNSARNFLKNTTSKNRLSDEIITDEFINYLNKRNANIKEELYSEIIY